MKPPSPTRFEPLLEALKAAGEETRLRILALLAVGEFNVSDLTETLGQSQPRISRHLKLLAEAGLVERHREGAWVFFRLADGAGAPQVLRTVLASLDRRDPLLASDQERLTQVREERSRAAERFFAQLAPDWDRLRSLHVPEAAVEAAILEVVGARPVRALLDLGTGTGRMLQLLAPLADRAVGVDASPAMLAVARAKLEAAGLARIELRQGDIHALPVERGVFDLVVLHQVLHFLDDPARALREAAAALAPGGRLLVVDFAPHEHEFLRERHQHRRLGFGHEQLEAWFDEAGLDLRAQRDLATGDKAHLTVTLSLGRDRRLIGDWPLKAEQSEVA
ncbi:ArsR/SmtB family transcription factor [Chelatococcus reniformis]|uniref:ArsR family transcriptional regulator n=1 Tax=Chelatococcus reniformis TaxID=1494448 RepID=A0A916UC63_9HYPH|nr:metalloregulator ArsR/SmtB family transcription factor [Chelatococcus reniformis]GGC66973.1 ArsR family transcriptional regulator [Chelatococcus reniformis]